MATKKMLAAKNGAKQKRKAGKSPRTGPSPMARLRVELDELKQENATLRKSLIALMREDIVIDKDAMLKEAAATPSLAELIAELESHGG